MLILIGSGPGVRTLTVVREVVSGSCWRQFEQQVGDWPTEEVDCFRVRIIFILLALYLNLNLESFVKLVKYDMGISLKSIFGW